MAKVIADHQIKDLIGSVVNNGDEGLIDPNGIKLRLGSEVRFHSTGEKQEVEKDKFLKIRPGESITFSSFEKIDFHPDTVRKHFPECSLMGILTPTTTMMREGIMNSTTKIDPGFVGELNWSLRNGGSNAVVLENHEPIVKLTIYLLEKDENPELSYGEREHDHYQNTKGVNESKRRIKANISEEDIIASSVDELDPKNKLKEAGYPFNFIGTELSDLDGKLEKVTDSSDNLSIKIDNMEDKLMSKVGQLLNNKFALLIAFGTFLISCLGFLYGEISNELLFGLLFIFGILISIGLYTFSKIGSKS